MTRPVSCTKCGAMLDESSNMPPENRLPCPQCGSTERTFHVFATDSVTVSDSAFFSVNHVLLLQAVITPYDKTRDGELIRAITLPLRKIIAAIQDEPDLMYQIDARKWEEIIAAAYEESKLFDDVTLTPRSGDRGRDVIAVKNGFGSVRLIESVKRYTPNHFVTAEEVDALIGGLLKDPKASKGIVSTTWKFAPRIKDDPGIAQLMPTRLELVDGIALLERLKEYTKGNNL